MKTTSIVAATVSALLLLVAATPANAYQAAHVDKSSSYECLMALDAAEGELIALGDTISALEAIEIAFARTTEPCGLDAPRQETREIDTSILENIGGTEAPAACGGGSGYGDLHTTLRINNVVLTYEALVVLGSWTAVPVVTADGEGFGVTAANGLGVHRASFIPAGLTTLNASASASCALRTICFPNYADYLTADSDQLEFIDFSHIRCVKVSVPCSASGRAETNLLGGLFVLTQSTSLRTVYCGGSILDDITAGDGSWIGLA